MNAIFGAITVSYASSEVLPRFIESWKEASGIGPILVVENSPKLPTLPNDVTLVHSATNLGYARGLEAGVRALVRGQNGKLPEWLLLSNPDISLIAGIDVGSVLSEVPESVGVVAPSITDYRLQRELNPLMRTPESPTKYQFLAALSAAGLLPFAIAARRRLGSWARPSASSAAPARIFAPHGAALFVRTHLPLTTGLLEHPQLLYGEESTLAIAASRAGIGVLYQPAIQLEHTGSTTISRAPSAKIRRLRTRGFLHTARLLRDHSRRW